MRGKMRIAHTAALSLLCAMILAGCATPDIFARTTHNQTNPAWETFEQISEAFARIKPGVTTVEELDQLGLGPHSANVTRLNYLRLKNRMQRTDQPEEELPESIRKCLAAKNSCIGLVIEEHNLRGEGEETLWERIAERRRETRQRGWKIEATIAVQNGIVVYARPDSENPNVEELIKEKDPQGVMERIVAPAIFSLITL